MRLENKLPVLSPVQDLTAKAIPAILNLLVVYRILETVNGTATADDLEHICGDFTLKSTPPHDIYHGIYHC